LCVLSCEDLWGDSIPLNCVWKDTRLFALDAAG
jgi:hypothetical protein